MASAEGRPDLEEDPGGEGDKRILEIIVQGGDVERALKVLKNKLQKDGFFKELKKRKHYEKPSVKKKNKQIEARRRKVKAFRTRLR